MTEHWLGEIQLFYTQHASSTAKIPSAIWSEYLDFLEECHAAYGLWYPEEWVLAHDRKKILVSKATAPKFSFSLSGSGSGSGSSSGPVPVPVPGLREASDHHSDAVLQQLDRLFIDDIVIREPIEFDRSMILMSLMKQIFKASLDQLDDYRTGHWASLTLFFSWI